VGATLASTGRGRRIHQIVQVGQRWRREDGLVILVVQVHRADESIEAKPVAPAVPCRFPVDFAMLREHFELLTRVG
jgi:hypothetical protein